MRWSIIIGSQPNWQQDLVANQDRIQGFISTLACQLLSIFYWLLGIKQLRQLLFLCMKNIDDLYVQNDSITGVAIVLQDLKKFMFQQGIKRSGHIFLLRPLNQRPIVLAFQFWTSNGSIYRIDLHLLGFRSLISCH